MSQVNNAGQFIKGCPEFHTVSKPPDHRGGVIPKGICSIPRSPASLFFKGVREVPVIKGDKGLHLPGKESIHKAFIEIQTLFIDGAGASGKNARPGYGKAISVDAKVFYQVKVLFKVVIVVTGEAWRLPVFHGAGSFGKHIPDGEPFAISLRGAINLGGCGRRPPQKSPRKSVIHHDKLPLLMIFIISRNAHEC
jgi:hypothetical protein